MKLVNAALAEKNLKLDQLPDDLREGVLGLKKSMFDYNIACEAFEDLEAEERTEEEEKRLDEMEHTLAEMEKVLSEKIQAFTPAPTPNPEPPAPNPPAPNPPAPNPPAPAKKEDNSLGWLIFGGVALVVTLGAVNVFKKRG